MPKQGTRTFWNLLRTFGIFGDEGRRLSFSLGNDISPVVDADNYDPLPWHAAEDSPDTVIGGEFILFTIEAPPTAHVFIRQYRCQPQGGVPVLVFYPGALSIPGFANVAGITPVSGLGNISRTICRVGTTTQVPTSIAHCVLNSAGAWVQLGHPIVLAPGRVAALTINADGTGYSSAGFMWTEVEQPPSVTR